jgi:hypothetical protein
MLLLFTPSSIDGEDIVEEVFRERLEITRATIIAIMGRNTTFEELFGVELEVEGDGTTPANLTFRTPHRDNPDAFDPPKMDEQSLEVVQSIIDKIGRLDEDVRNRVSLALRWYQRAQGYRRTETASDTDGFISLWVALERLVPGTKAVNSINGNLAEIHNDQTFEQIGELFCLGRISDLRNKIVHEGKRPVIEGTLLRFLAAVFRGYAFACSEINQYPENRRL